MLRRVSGTVSGAAAVPACVARAQNQFEATRNRLRAGWKDLAVLVVRVAAFAFLAWTAAAQPAVITKLEPYNTDQLLIHMDVQANTTCTLQYTGILSTNGVSVTWSNLYAAPTLPFFEHYIILDTRTNQQRFYRLLIAR